MQGLRPLYRYFEFCGRSGRAEFWQYFGLLIVALLLAFLVDLGINQSFPIITAIVYLGLLIPTAAVSFRRLHDRDYSGWWYIVSVALALVSILAARAAAVNAYTVAGDFLQSMWTVLSIIQVIYSLVLIVQLALPGEPNENRFGSAPTNEGPAPTFSDIAVKVREQARPAFQISSASAALPPRTPATASDIDPLAQIERLAKLRDAGMLTEEEFQAQKAALLSRL